MNAEKTLPSLSPATERVIPESPVPWDPAELQGRNCQSCACYFEAANPMDPTQVQGFCRRQPADLIKLRGEVPRVDQKGQPVLRDGKPVMNSQEIPGFLFKLAQSQGTCFDGWRPKGTLPGETPAAAVIKVAAAHIEPLLKDLPDTLRPIVRAIFGLEPTH